MVGMVRIAYSRFQQPGAIGSSSDEDSEECEEEFFCTVCESARNPMSKNRRRNTSMLIHYQGRNIVIDCGKVSGCEKR